MRIHDLERRIRLDRSKEHEMFTDELAYYRERNQYPATIFGKRLVNIYKNINVQVIISRRCNYRCGFCIENDGISAGEKEQNPALLTSETLRQYREQGVMPCVSITGGEPTLFPDRLRDVLAATKRHGIQRVNINTNGTNPQCVSDLDGYMVNLSRHHWQRDKIEAVFGKQCDDILLPKRTVMQCVLMRGFVDGVTAMKGYMNHFLPAGAIGFSFRGLTRLDAGKEYSKEIDWTAAHETDAFAIANAVADDPDFQFVQQKIGDHYWFEIWKYRGVPMRITYSNFAWLREVEAKERADGDWFSRATIILPSGKVFAGWTYDLNEIYDSGEALLSNEKGQR